MLHMAGLESGELQPRGPMRGQAPGPLSHHGPTAGRDAGTDS